MRNRLLQGLSRLGAVAGLSLALVGCGGMAYDNANYVEKRRNGFVFAYYDVGNDGRVDFVDVYNDNTKVMRISEKDEGLIVMRKFQRRFERINGKERK